ncbi:MAG: non-heme iron oxygenase ferredoxin subunit [Acidimicrobiales bacterium]
MAERVVLCQRDDLDPGEARRFDGPTYRIALARVGDEFFAVGDRCSHENYSLSDGEVWADECEIECPQHGSTFSLRTGAACTLPATQPVPVYAVVVEGDDVVVTLP